MMNRNNNNRIKLLALSILTMVATSSTVMAQTAPPPTLGQNTKGTPAIEETVAQDSSAPQNVEDVAPTPEQTGTTTVVSEQQKKAGPLGSATIKESRRENGQRYLIELEHSAGAKQYIEETDSDGNIQPTSDDLEETPNLPKWKLGSW